MFRFLKAGVSVEQTTEPGTALAAPAVRSFFYQNTHVLFGRTYLPCVLYCYVVGASVLAALAVEYFPVKDLLKIQKQYLCIATLIQVTLCPFKYSFLGWKKGTPEMGSSLVGHYAR